MIRTYNFATVKDEPDFEGVEKRIMEEVLAGLVDCISFDSSHSIIISRPEKFDPFDELSFKLDRYKFWVAIDEDPR